MQELDAEINSTETLTDPNAYSLFVTNIVWGKSSQTKTKFLQKDKNIEYPTQYIVELPENVLTHANKVSKNFNDIVETYTYNFLTRKFGREVDHCQIWLPLENEEAIKEN